MGQVFRPSYRRGNLRENDKHVGEIPLRHWVIRHMGGENGKRVFELKVIKADLTAPGGTRKTDCRHTNTPAANDKKQLRPGERKESPVSSPLVTSRLNFTAGKHQWKRKS